MVTLTAGVFGGYSLALVTNATSHPSHTDIQLRSFAASYGALRNIKEKDNNEAIVLMYTMMNNSLKEMYSLYPGASEHDKQMIYLSFTGYTEFIQNNPDYKLTDEEINKLIESIIKEHNKSSNLTGAKNAPSS